MVKVLESVIISVGHHVELGARHVHMAGIVVVPPSLDLFIAVEVAARETCLAEAIDSGSV
jgi:hypothetical protein